jgi:putative DNA primase/helicase
MTEPVLNGHVAPVLDPFEHWETLTTEQQLGEILRTFSAEDWLKEPALSVLASFRAQPILWARIAVRWSGLTYAGIGTLEAALDHWRTALGAEAPRRGRGRPPNPRAPLPPNLPGGDWQERLLCNTYGEPKQCVSNIWLLLTHAFPGRDEFWLDEVRGLPMIGQLPIEESLVTDICRWLGEDARMVVTNRKLVGDVVVDLCKARPRDLLKEWLESLPPFEGPDTPLLDRWLIELAGAPDTPYGRDLSRLLLVSMVARAYEPGCQYRYVVLLEGPENTGKSKLVRVLAGPEWSYECIIGLEGKEAYMAIQGAWLVELPELNAMSRTEESHFKGLVSQVKDSWIPKFANHRIEKPRRAIFVGTLNPEGLPDYLRGQTGNTRYLPVPTGAIDVAAVEDCRTRLFREAVTYFRLHPQDWWAVREESQAELALLREERRVSSVYQDDLADWLERECLTTTTWQEIANRYLRLEPAAWKDKGMQRQIADALHGLGWKNRLARGGPQKKPRREWVKPVLPLPTLFGEVTTTS